MLKVNLNFQGVKRGFRKIAWFLGERAFISFIVFFFLTLFITSAIFYYYGFLAATGEPFPAVKIVELDKDIYQDFLDNHSQRKRIFFEIDSKDYFNPFFQD